MTERNARAAARARALEGRGEGYCEGLGGVLEGAGGGEVGAGQEGGQGFGGELVAVFGVDGFALGEGDEIGVVSAAAIGEVDRLGGEAFEVHLDAGGGGVPAGSVGEGVEGEVGVEVAVEAGEDVFVEGGGDSGCVVVGGEEGGDSFFVAGGEIDAEEQSVAGLEMAAEGAEDGRGFGGGEVAYAGADVEGEDFFVLRTLEGVGLGNVVGDLGVDADAGDGGGEVGGGFVERGGADVDGLVEDFGLEVSCCEEEEAGFGGGAGAELGDGDGRGEFAENVVSVGGEEGALGAGEVVLGECGDLFEELRAALVVEEPRGEGFLRGGEAGKGFVEDGFVEFGGGFGGHLGLGGWEW
jgi:hypothetical protein